MAAPFDLSQVPWPYLLAFASLGAIYWLFRRRADAFAGIGFSSKEVALLLLGSTAGWAVNLPLLPLGNSYLAVNAGGVLVPVVVTAIWLKKRKLNPLLALAGTLLVSVVAYRIVRFEPAVGIVAVFPWFFLPTLVALGFALLVHARNPLRSVPLAYVSGSLGALLGADIYNYGVISEFYRAQDENAIISIGGAGVFDMVFLAGALAMAVDLALVVALDRRGAPPAPETSRYPGRPVEVRSPERAWDAFVRLPDPRPAERALATLALSDSALAAGDYDRAVRMAGLAVDEALLAARRAPERGTAMERDLGVLRRAAERARALDGTGGARLGRREAGAANSAAKLLVAALAGELPGPNRLEGA